MRHGLPIWHCLDYATQAKLAPLLDNPSSIPPCEWKEWEPDKIELGNVDYDKFMRQAPLPRSELK